MYLNYLICVLLYYTIRFYCLPIPLTSEEKLLGHSNAAVQLDPLVATAYRAIVTTIESAFYKIAAR
jgi:hypothetical protein